MTLRLILMCLAGVLAAPGSLWAQTPEPARSARPVDATVVAVTESEPGGLTVGVSGLTTIVEPLRRRPARSAQASSSGRTGLIVGLVAGTAAAYLYWTARRCGRGSDSQAAWATHCFVPSAAMIVGAGYLGRRLGR